MASYLRQQGAPLSTPRAGPVAPAALPKTGAADSRALSDWLVLVAPIGLIAGGCCGAHVASTNEVDYAPPGDRVAWWR
jgi:hypothetical protein